MAPGVSAGSRRTRGAITVSQPAGQRPGRAGAAAGPGRGPGRAVPSAERGAGGCRAGAKVIPPAAPRREPGSLRTVISATWCLPRLAACLPPPPSGASALRRLSGTVTRCLPPHAPRPPRRRCGERARGAPRHRHPPPRPRRRPPARAGTPSHRGERRRSLRRPAGLGSPNSETCYLRAPAERGLPARLPPPNPPPPHPPHPPTPSRPRGRDRPAARPGALLRRSSPSLARSFARPAAGRFLAPGRRRGAG